MIPQKVYQRKFRKWNAEIVCARDLSSPPHKHRIFDRQSWHMYAMRNSAQHPILMRFFAPNSKFAQLYSINSEFFYVFLEQRNIRLLNMLMSLLWPEPGMIFSAAFFAWFGLTLVGFHWYIICMDVIKHCACLRSESHRVAVRRSLKIGNRDKIFHHVPWVRISYTTTIWD